MRGSDSCESFSRDERRARQQSRDDLGMMSVPGKRRTLFDERRAGRVLGAGRTQMGGCPREVADVAVTRAPYPGLSTPGAPAQCWRRAGRHPVRSRPRRRFDSRQGPFVLDAVGRFQCHLRELFRRLIQPTELHQRHRSRAEQIHMIGQKPNSLRPPPAAPRSVDRPIANGR